MVGRVGFMEVTTAQSGMKIAKLSIALSERHKDKEGQWQEKTTWVSIKLFQKTAEFIESYVQKGDIVYVDGKLNQEKYTGKDGVEKTIMTIKVDEFKKLSGKSDKPTSQASDNHGNVKEPQRLDDDIPW